MPEPTDTTVPLRLPGLTLAELERHAGPRANWTKSCHEVSLAIVRSGLLNRFGPARVVRGTAHGVGAQHSWIALGSEISLARGPAAVDVYDPATWYLDLTLWSYCPDAPLIVLDTGYNTDPDPLQDLIDDFDEEGEEELDPPYRQWGHRPHGSGSIFDYPMPTSAGGEIIELNASVVKRMSAHAQSMLRSFGPLDQHGWMLLAHLPAMGAAVAEVLTLMASDTRLRAMIPIDTLGNATNVNPNNLYW